MTCEQLRDVLPGYLYDELDAVERQAVEAHLHSCPACADTVSGLRSTQKALDTWVTSDNGMTKAEVQDVLDGATVSNGKRGSPRHLLFSLTTGAIAAVVVFAALSSYQSRTGSPVEQLAMNNRTTQGDPSVMSPDETSNEFLLLLLERPSMLANLQTVKEDDLVMEYGAWAGGVAENNRTIVGKKLTDERHVLGADAPDASVVDDAETVAGYFRIEADSLEEAMNVARSCPHLKYGGRIEVREVDGRTQD